MDRRLIVRGSGLTGADRGEDVAFLSVIVAIADVDR